MRIMIEKKTTYKENQFSRHSPTKNYSGSTRAPE